GSLDYQFNKLLAPKHHKGLLAAHGDNESIAQLERTRIAADEFFSSIRIWMNSQSKGTGRVRQSGIVGNPLSEELRKLASDIHDCAEALKTDEEKIELVSSENRCLAFATGIEEWLEQSRKGHVYWIETQG